MDGRLKRRVLTKLLFIFAMIAGEVWSWILFAGDVLFYPLLLTIVREDTGPYPLYPTAKSDKIRSWVQFSTVKILHTSARNLPEILRFFPRFVLVKPTRVHQRIDSMNNLFYSTSLIIPNVAERLWKISGITKRPNHSPPKFVKWILKTATI